jgi:hypothetical protein
MAPNLAPVARRFSAALQALEARAHPA